MLRKLFAGTPNQRRAQMLIEYSYRLCEMDYPCPSDLPYDVNELISLFIPYHLKFDRERCGAEYWVSEDGFTVQAKINRSPKDNDQNNNNNNTNNNNKEEKNENNNDNNNNNNNNNNKGEQKEEERKERREEPTAPKTLEGSVLFGPRFQLPRHNPASGIVLQMLIEVSGNVGIGIASEEYNIWDKLIHNNKVDYVAHITNKTAASQHRPRRMSSLHDLDAFGISSLTSKCGRGVLALWRNGYHLNTFDETNTHERMFIQKAGTKIQVTLDLRQFECTIRNIDLPDQTTHTFDLSFFRHDIGLIFSLAAWHQEDVYVKVLSQTWL